LGAFLAAGSVLLIYHNSIELAGGKTNATRAIFATYPNDKVSPSTLTLGKDIPMLKFDFIFQFF